MKKPPYRIEFTLEADAQVKDLGAGDRAALLDGVFVQLQREPARESRNRKRLRPNPLASHRLRVEKLRVYYDGEESTRVVTVRAVGIKDRNRVLVAGKEIEL